MKRRSIILTIFATMMVFCFSHMAFAAEPHLSEKEAAAVNISNFWLDKDKSIEKLNEVADAPVIDVQEYTLSNGDEVRVEIRELEVSDDLTITNKRTYIISATTHTISDEYGLPWGGQAGLGGTLIATYKYQHPTIDGPNSMTTKFTSASGRAEDLMWEIINEIIGGYRLVDTDAHWDDDESYSPEASVEFNMQVKSPTPTAPWQDFNLTNICAFNRYGVASFDWE